MHILNWFGEWNRRVEVPDRSRGVRGAVFVAALVVAAAPASAAAQEPAVVTGRVTGAGGAPLGSATVAIAELGVGATTRADGSYSFTVPGARVQGQTTTLTARLIGYKPDSARVTLRSGNITQDFSLETNPLQLGEVVITGAGTSAEVEKIGTVRNTVSADQIIRSNEPNLVQALAGKAPNVQVSQSSGEPGASSHIRMRGVRSLSGTGQPLFVVDGMPIDNFSYSTSNFNPIDELGSGEGSGTAQTNRAADINPDDIENIEILKGPAASAIYGARAAQGVVLITTKRGRPGPTRYSLRSSYSWDEVTREYPLQKRYGAGSGGVAADCAAGDATCVRSWGAAIPAGTEVFDHAMEAFDTGHITDNSLGISGGTDRTSFYFSLSRLHNEGIFKGPNNEYERTTVRLNASHRLIDDLNLGANVSYADSRGQFVHRGNNANGLALGLLRTPPDFDNRVWKDENGLQRSYRVPNRTPADARVSSGFDNPFWALYENENTARVGRVFGNIAADYTPNGWFRLNYTLGVDQSTDERLEGMPIGSAGEGAEGRVTEGTIVNNQLDHNLTGTATYSVSPVFGGTLTLGHNLNERSTRQLSAVGRTMVATRPFKLTNTVSRDLPLDTEENIRQESFFGQATFDLFDQLFLVAALRNDGSSTFSESHRRSWFPKASAAWTFTDYLANQSWLTFGKLRVAYGEAGQEPDAYLTSPTFDGATPISGVVQGTGLSPTQAGFGGLVTALTKAADVLKPERTKEFEAGFDIGLWEEMADLSFTLYRSRTEDVILLTPLAPSTGYYVEAQNSAEFSNRGVEVSLNVRPLRSERYNWDIGLQWARNRSMVEQLDAADFIRLDGINTISPYAVAKEGQPVGVFYDYGLARCGISPGGMDAVIEDVDLDVVCAGQPRGALYIADNGFPVGDDNLRVIGDPNPDWTGSLQSSFSFGKVRLSGLAEIKKGGVINNGTKGALLAYGTHKDTEQRANCTSTSAGFVCTGNEKVFGQKGFYEGPVVGPGANTPVPIGQNWYGSGALALGNCLFSGYSEECMEDGGYVKLRELAVAYTVDTDWVQRQLGFTSVELRLAGRNLKTWTDYTGFDPETEFGQAIQRTRGMDYFNMPQSRSFILSVALNR